MKQTMASRPFVLRRLNRPHAASVHRLLAAFILASPLPALCQASITGTVLDGTGAAVPGANLSAVLASTGAVRHAQSDDGGRFRIANLPIGLYTIRCERQGFQPAEFQDVSLSIGQTLEEHIALRITSRSETVEVRGQPEALATTAVNSDVALGGERIDDTPLQKRNYLNFVLLAPGVAAAANSNALRATAALKSADEDSGFTFGGLRARNNGLYIDTLDNRDAMSGGNRVAVSPDMVQEFQVAGSDIPPATGGAAGANINVVTLSGTNRWHGDSSFFTGNQTTNARDPDVEARVRPLYRLYNPEATLGGPLRRDHTFFYTAVEQEWESTQDTSEIPDGRTLSQINTALASPGFSNAATHRLSDALTPSGSSSTMVFGKVDQQINSANSVFARYGLSRGSETNDVLGTSNFADLSARGSSVTQDQSAAVGWTTAPGSTFVNQLRAQYAHRGVTFTPNSRGALLEIPGVVSFGQATQLDSATSQNYFQAVESVTLIKGNHQLGFGINAQHIRFDNDLPNRFAGIFIFPTVTAFSLGTPDVFLQRCGDPHTRYSTTPVGVWAQDQWQLGHGFTLVAGIRYDAQRLPKPIPSATNNWSPRVGIAWHPGKSGWVIRGSAGFFYDTYPFAFLNDAIQTDGIHGFEQYAVGASAAQAFALTQGGTQTAPLPNVAHSFYKPDSYFPSTYARHLTAGIERSFGPDTTVTAEYLNVHGFHLPRLRNSSTGFTPIYQLEQGSSSKYQGVSVALNRRFNHELAYLLSYTESRAYDDASDFNQQPLDPNNTRLDWSRSDQYQAHRLAASGVFELPFGDMMGAPVWLRRFSHEFEFGPVVNFGSSRPINQLQTTDVYRTGAYPISARPPGIARNSGNDGGLFAFDARISKGFTVPKDHGVITVGVNGFNLTNHTNPLRVSPYYNNESGPLASYGRLVEGLNARQIRFTLEWEF